MLPFEDRFTRQRQLREVGMSGQARLAARSASVLAGPFSDVEATYLERAGVQVLRNESAPAEQAESFPHAAHFRDDMIRQFAARIHRALGVIRETLEFERRAPGDAAAMSERVVAPCPIGTKEQGPTGAKEQGRTGETESP